MQQTKLAEIILEYNDIIQETQKLMAQYTATTNEIRITFLCLCLFSFLGLLIVAFFKKINLFKDKVFNQIQFWYLVISILLFINLIIKGLILIGISSDLFQMIVKLLSLE